MVIRTSKHSTKFLNTGKLEAYYEFLDDYSNALKFFVDYLFNSQISYDNKVFSIKDDLLDCPMFLSFPELKDTDLSARALKCAESQACGIVKSAVSQRRKLLYRRSKLIEEGKRTRNISRKIAKTPVIYPVINNQSAELNSICCELKQSNNSFNYWIVLKSIGKKYGKIIIPLKGTKHSNKYEGKYNKKSSFLFKKDSVDIRWEIPIEKKTEGKIVGADTGMLTCVTLSDSQITPKDKYGHDLKSICDKLARKKKGSKGYKRAQAHRENYINWSINQLNLDDIKQVNLENVNNFRYKKHTSKKLNSWTNTAIREKIESRCELLGVQVKLQSSSYRSQRCSCCGYVCKANRVGKSFSCKRCTFSADADLNASLNHEVELPPITLKQRPDNKRGFFWKEEGLFDLAGQELVVTVTKRRDS